MCIRVERELLQVADHIGHEESLRVALEVPGTARGIPEADPGARAHNVPHFGRAPCLRALLGGNNSMTLSGLDDQGEQVPSRDMEHILFLTGRLAEASLKRVLDGIESPPFTWEVREIGLQVAALMTADMIARRLPPPDGADRIMVPGRCRGDLAALGTRYGIPVVRGSGRAP